MSKRVTVHIVVNRYLYLPDLTPGQIQHPERLILLLEDRQQLVGALLSDFVCVEVQTRQRCVGLERFGEDLRAFVRNMVVPKLQVGYAEVLAQDPG
eukprot:1368930-Amorphochlora_amoeboformis.AAC.1